MRINKYIKNPMPVEAFKWIEAFVGISNEISVYVYGDDCLKIRTSELWVSAEIGDYIIKDTYGNLYSCDAIDFEQKYKLAQEWKYD